MINIDMIKAKEIAHERRRADRDAKLEPMDRKVTYDTSAEAERQAIRDNNKTVQDLIDAATDVEAIKTALGDLV